MKKEGQKQQVEKTCDIFANLLFYKVARPEGFEPPTAWFVVSILVANYLYLIVNTGASVARFA